MEGFIICVRPKKPLHCYRFGIGNFQVSQEKTGTFLFYTPVSSEMGKYHLEQIRYFFTMPNSHLQKPSQVWDGASQTSCLWMTMLARFRFWDSAQSWIRVLLRRGDSWIQYWNIWRKYQESWKVNISISFIKYYKGYLTACKSLDIASDLVIIQ